MTSNKEQGGEHLSNEQLTDTLEQIRAVNKLTNRNVITPEQRKRAYSKIVPGLGDVMDKTDRGADRYER